MYMFTLLWTKFDIDGWDRFNSKEEMEDKIKKLMDENFSTEDMMIFSPEVDYIVPEEDGTVVL